MTKRARGVWQRWATAQGAILLGAAVLLAGAGCARQYLRPDELTAELVAPPAQDLKRQLVSRLPRFTASKDLIERGDLLEVTVDAGYSEKPARTSLVRVAEDGTARIPVLGTVALGGLTLQEAEQAIAMAARERQLLPDPYVSVTMQEQRKNRVTVLGPVGEEGVVELPRGSSYLLDALVAAGNLKENAGLDVQIRRPARYRGPPGRLPLGAPRVADGPQAELASYAEAGVQPPQTIYVDLVRAAQEGHDPYYLEDGDVVVVSEEEPRAIHVIGLVNEAGEHKLPCDRDVHLLQALALAKGRTSQLADRVLIFRERPRPMTIVTSVREAKKNPVWNVRLAGGDVVSVEETPTTFVLDLLRSFVRFGFSGTTALF